MKICPFLQFQKYVCQIDRCRPRNLLQACWYVIESILNTAWEISTENSNQFHSPDSCSLLYNLYSSTTEIAIDNYSYPKANW